MGLFDFLKGPDFDQSLELCRSTPGAVLLDVRTQEEYAAGHVPGSVSLPLHQIAGVGDIVPRQDVPLFVYCLSGARSGQAASWLRRAGYTTVTNLGGISRYHGKVVTGA